MLSGGRGWPSLSAHPVPDLSGRRAFFQGWGELECLMSYNSWMPLYWGDYLSSTGHLSTVEHGAYLLLIGHLWMSDGKAPNDNTKLARIVRLTQPEWFAVRQNLEPFFEIDRWSWSHRRVSAELIRARSTHENRVRGGIKSANKRNGLEVSAPVRLESNPPQSQSQSDIVSKKEASPIEVSALLSKAGDQLKGRSTLPPHERKAVWQSRICQEAQRTMPNGEYSRWLEAFGNNEPWAKRKAEEINTTLKARNHV